MGDGIAKAVIGSVGGFSYWSSMLCYKKWVAIMGIIFIGTSYWKCMKSIFHRKDIVMIINLTIREVELITSELYSAYDMAKGDLEDKRANRIAKLRDKILLQYRKQDK